MKTNKDKSDNGTAVAVQRMVRLRRRSKLSRLIYAPKIIKQCWKLTKHPAVTTKTRLQFAWRNVTSFLKG